MDKLQLVLGTVNSLCNGENQDLLENRYQTAYRPAVKAFYRFPRLQFTLYYSGLLLQWLDDRHSEFISALMEMYQARNLELLMGAYAEPLMPLVPRQDRIGQLEYMSNLMRKTFRKRIHGAWLEPMVWEQELVSSLNSAGLEYVFLDDYHFEKAGLPASVIHRPIITDDQGKAITVLPVSNRLSRLCWKADPGELVAMIRDLAVQNPGELLCLMFSGEADQAGMPKREEDREEWLGAFLEGLQSLQEEGVIQTIHPARYLKREQRRPWLYLPATQYMEMQSWSADQDERRQFNSARASLQRGPGLQGYFHGRSVRQQLSRYVESRLLYAKMQHVHTAVNQIRGDRYRRDAGREALWQGQSNGAYWHGNHGGIYCPWLRAAAYQSLIKAEIHSREKGIFATSVSALDLDLDGLGEFLYQSQELNAYLHRQGAALFELDFLPGAVNYLATMSRYPESYHDQVTRSEGYDTLPHWGFMDNFIFPGRTGSLPEYKRDALMPLGGMDYEVEELRKESRSVRFSLRTELKSGNHSWKILLHKTYTFNKSRTYVSYQIQNLDVHPLEVYFCPEINLSLLAADLGKLRFYTRNLDGEQDLSLDLTELPEYQTLVLDDHLNRASIELILSEPAPWWKVALDATYRHNGHQRTSTQGHSFFPRFRLALEPGFSHDLDIVLAVDRMRGAMLLN